MTAYLLVIHLIGVTLGGDIKEYTTYGDIPYKTQDDCQADGKKYMLQSKLATAYECRLKTVTQ